MIIRSSTATQLRALMWCWILRDLISSATLAKKIRSANLSTKKTLVQFDRKLITVLFVFNKRSARLLKSLIYDPGFEVESSFHQAFPIFAGQVTAQPSSITSAFPSSAFVQFLSSNIQKFSNLYHLIGLFKHHVVKKSLFSINRK